MENKNLCIQSYRTRKSIYIHNGWAEGEWRREEYLKGGEWASEREIKKEKNTIYLNVINMSIYWI